MSALMGLFESVCPMALLLLTPRIKTGTWPLRYSVAVAELTIRRLWMRILRQATPLKWMVLVYPMGLPLQTLLIPAVPTRTLVLTLYV